jgi:hypothetical protein
MRYAWQICFQGNKNSSYGQWLRPYRSKKVAKVALFHAEGCGRRWGAFLRRMKISEADWQLARD